MQPFFTITSAREWAAESADGTVTVLVIEYYSQPRKSWLPCELKRTWVLAS